MSQWFRVWEDMVNDPKWRVVARRSGRPVAEVIAVFMHMMTNAAGAAERGNLSNWNDEDVAISIDVEVEHVVAIRSAMQGKTLDGDHLTGWEKRQPKREDNSAERAKEWRKRTQTEPEGGERKRTQTNAGKRPEEKRAEKKGSTSNEVGDAPTAEKLLFDRAVSVLGRNGRSLCAMVLKAKGGNVALARASIEQASTMSRPDQWIGGVIRAGPSPKAADGLDEARRMLRERHGAASDETDKDHYPAGGPDPGDVQPRQALPQQGRGGRDDEDRFGRLLDLRAVRAVC